MTTFDNPRVFASTWNRSVDEYAWNIETFEPRALGDDRPRCRWYDPRYPHPMYRGFLSRLVRPKTIDDFPELLVQQERLRQ